MSLKMSKNMVYTLFLLMREWKIQRN